MYTSEVEINEFICEYKRSKVIIESTVRAVLKRATEYEEVFKKPFTKFSYEEALMMYKESKALSVTSLLNYNLILKHAVNWKIMKNGENIDNIYEKFSKDQLKGCVDADKKAKMLLSREQLNEIKDNLLNETDKAILEMLFRGAGGKWAMELTYLSEQQVSREQMCVYFKTGKKILIDNECYKILKRAFSEDELISYNIASSKVSKVTSVGIYKIRSNTLHLNNDPRDMQDAERRFRWVQRRLYIIADYMDTPLTVSSLQTSGLYHCIKEGLAETKMTFREFIQTDRAKQIAKTYDIYTDLYATVLIDKFKEYFE